MMTISDNAVVPEEQLHDVNLNQENEGPDRHITNTSNDTWMTPQSSQLKSEEHCPPEPIEEPPKVRPAIQKGSWRATLRRMTKLFISSEDEPDPAKRKEHYRRGSILIKHLEEKKARGKATEKDMKFFDTVKSHFDSHSLESRTIISLSVFQTGSNPMEDPFAVIHMPVEIQQGFRRKLFAIFSLQLFVVVVFISLLGYVPVVSDGFQDAFQEWQYVFAAFMGMVLLLLWLYLVKYRFPLNFIVLGLYTLAQSVFFTAFDCFFATKASIFIFSFLFFIMAMTTLMCTMITKRSHDDNVPSALISFPVVLLVGYLLTFIGSLFIYFFVMQDIMSTLEYCASLTSVLLLVIWFAYDASCMNERLSPDEYMQGMVFFYTDMVLFLLFLSIIFVACFACEGDCACYGTADIAPFGTGTMDDGEGENEGREGEVNGEVAGEDTQ